MSNSSPSETIFLVDSDHTLFDMGKLKDYLSGQLLKIFGSQHLVDNFWLLDKTLRKQPHYLTKIMKTFCEQHNMIHQMNDVQNAFLHVDFPLFTLPGATKFLSDLHQFGKPYIFSEGDELYQQVKVHQSGLSRYVADTLIFDNKIKNIPMLAKSLQPKTLWIIDNKMSYLQNAQEIFPSIQTIFINHFHFTPDSDFTPTFKSVSFADIINFLKYAN